MEPEEMHLYAAELLHSTHVQSCSGRNNWVFLSDDEVLTIPCDPRVRSYGVRVAAMCWLKKQGIPTTEVVAYHPEKKHYPFEYLILKRIDAKPVTLSQLTAAERIRVHESAGHTLSTIHQLSAQSFGRLDETLHGPFPAWNEFVHSFFTAAFDDLKKTDLIKVYGDQIEQKYEQLQHLAQYPSSHFLHGDYHLGNLLFKDLSAAAVLDLDIVMGGDPGWDIAHYIHTFNIDRVQGRRTFRKSYGGSFDPEREQLYALVIWTKKISSQARKRPGALKETIPELEKILRG